MPVRIMPLKNTECQEEIAYSIVSTSLGKMLVASTDKGICLLMFADDTDEVYEELCRRFPKAAIIHKRTEKHRDALEFIEGRGDEITLHLKGTYFQLMVWRTVLGIGRGSVMTYGELAKIIGKPKAYRAVGAAVGANPVAVIIPCHRVVPSSGGIGNYRWGVERKRMLLISETENYLNDCLIF